jgi:hypothetical protein
VCFGSVTPVRLERTFAFHRTANVSERLPRVSIEVDCVTVGVLRSHATPGAHNCSQPRSKPMSVWSLPKVFHTCGKNCGKSSGFAGAERERAEKPGTSMGETLTNPL